MTGGADDARFVAAAGTKPTAIISFGIGFGRFTMIRNIAAPLGLALLSSALLLTSPAKAGYDPCQRATQQMITARTAYENATCNPRNCSGDTRYWALYAIT